MASEIGNYQIMHYLLENYSNVNAKNKEGLTPLFYAVHTKHKENIKLLIEYGADPNITNNRNETVLKTAKGEDYKNYLKS